MWVPEDKRQVEGKGYGTGNGEPVNDLLEAIVTQDHDHVEWNKEPCDLLACHGETQEDSGEPAFIAEEPGDDDEQDREDVKIAPHGGGPHGDVCHREKQDPWS